MSKKRNILVVSEGPNDKRFISLLFREFINDCPFKIVTFKTDIYQLFNLYAKHGDNWDEISLPTLLLAQRKRLNQKELEDLRENFTDIFLIFDFDPQAPAYDPQKLLALMKHFRDSTDHGRLYINYPMLEAFRYISNKDLETGGISASFQNLEFEKHQLTSKQSNKNFFKTLVAKEGIKKQILHGDWITIIRNHSNKARQIIGMKTNIPLSQEDLIILLQKQSSAFESTHKAKVVNTSLLIVEEYFNKTL